MKTKKQKPTRLLLPLIAFVLLGVVGIGYFVINPKIQEIRKFKEIKELTEKSFDPAYPNTAARNGMTLGSACAC